VQIANGWTMNQLAAWLGRERRDWARLRLAFAPGGDDVKQYITLVAAAIPINRERLRELIK